MRHHLLSITASAIFLLLAASPAFSQKMSSAKAPAITVIYDSIYYYYSDGDGPLELSMRDIELIYNDTLLMSYTNQTLIGGEWINGYLRTYTYNDEGKPLTQAYSPWNGSTFEDYSKITWRYGDNDSITLYLHEMMSDTGWSVIERHERVYGNNNLLVEEVSYSNWATTRSVYSYNDDMLKDSVFVFSLNADQWENDYVMVYSYDDNNNNVTTTILDWNDDELTPLSITTSIYDANNNLVRKVAGYYMDTLLVYDSYDSLWYDSENRLLGQLKKIWNEDEWENHQITEYTFDSDGNMIERQSQLWNYSSWVPEYINTITYRENIPESQKWIQYEYFSDDIAFIDSVWYYFGIVTDVHNLPRPTESVQAFPNPTSGNVTLTTKSEILSIRVYAPGGKLLPTGHSRHNNGNQAQLDLSGNKPGVYIIDLHSRTGRSTVKILRR